MAGWGGPIRGLGHGCERISGFDWRKRRRNGRDACGGRGVDEDSCEELERIGQGVVVELGSGFRLVDEQAGAAVEPQSGKVDRSSHEITGKLAGFAKASAGQGAVRRCQGDKRWCDCERQSLSDSNNAPRTRSIEVKLTHPCHPFTGAPLRFIVGPRTTSRDWVVVELCGEERKLPLAWTSLAAVDPYRLLSKPPLLRIESLVELSEWVRWRKCARRG